MRLPGADKAALVQEALDQETCCIDRLFTQRLLKAHTPAELVGPVFERVLASIDADDSAVTIVECERAHGKLRVGYGKALQTIERAMAKAFLQEWGQEHRDAGLGHSQKPPECERLRGAVTTHLRAERQEKKQRGKQHGGGNPRFNFVMAMDAARSNPEVRRSLLQVHQDRAAIGQLWDDMDEHDPGK